MSKSIVSANSNTSKVSVNRHKSKICGFDGKRELGNYANHNKVHHDGEKLEWDGVSEIPNPWCTNWKEIIDNPDQKIDPIGKRSEFIPNFGAANTKKSVVGVASKSIVNGGNDVEMQNINEQEEVKEVAAVPQSEQLQSNNNLGKRPSATKSAVLKAAVDKDIGWDDSASAVAARLKRSKTSTSQIAAKTPATTNGEHYLSEYDLQQIETSKAKVNSYMNSQQEFKTPEIRLITQGMRDGEAIQMIIDLDKQSTDMFQVSVLELIKLLPYFSQAQVASYIERTKDSLTNIKDLIGLAQSRTDILQIEDIASIAFASVLFGGSVWASLPKMFAQLDANILDDVLLRFGSLIESKFNHLTDWICTSWKYLEEQTLTLLIQLKKQSNLLNSLSFDIATISRMVQIEQVNHYLTTVEVFSRSPSFRIMMDSIKTSAYQWKSEQKLSFKQFCALVFFLTDSANRYLILQNEQDLIDLPLSQWMDRLTTLQSASLICDVESIQYRLDQLCTIVGVLPLQICQQNLQASVDNGYARTFHHVTNKPNALQFANAQYAAFALSKYPRQLWNIPSGQGKSRVLATIALILLLCDQTPRVHLVFDSKHLMMRDLMEFEYWFQSNNISVSYHVGLDFEVSDSRDVILIDEADEIILSDPAKFDAKIADNKCICLTATPDNADKHGVEREILLHLKFKFIQGQSTQQIANSDSSLCSTEPLSFGPDSQLIEFIVKRLSEQAVLLYCSKEFQQLLDESNVPFISMNDGNGITDEFLRTLEKRNENGSHTLIVATSSFGMRGFDYRSNKGITLIIAASFDNQRSSIQGLNRVGRFNDECKRYLVKGIELIDKSKEQIYIGGLMRYMRLNQTRKLTIQPKPSTKPKKQITTNTNAKTTAPNSGKATPRNPMNLNLKQTSLGDIAKVQKKKAVIEEVEEDEEVIINSQMLV